MSDFLLFLGVVGVVVFMIVVVPFVLFLLLGWLMGGRP